jgi:hypothetical protein
MSTGANVGIGAVLNRWDGSAFQEVMEVTNISWDGPTREVIDVFRLNNSDDYVNKLQGVINANSVSATVLYTLAQYLILKADLETRGLQDWQIILPDGEGLEWSGFVTEIPLDMGSDDAMQGEVVVEINGKPDLVSTATA